MIDFCCDDGEGLGGGTRGLDDGADELVLVRQQGGPVDAFARSRPDAEESDVGGAHQRDRLRHPAAAVDHLDAVGGLGEVRMRVTS